MIYLYFMEIDPAIPLLISVIGTLGTLAVGLFAFRQKEGEIEANRMETSNKADKEYVYTLEHRLDRAEQRADRAEERLEQCELARDELKVKIKALEERVQR